MNKLVQFSIAAMLTVGVVGCKQAAKEGEEATQGKPADDIQVALLAPAASDFWSIIAAGAEQGAKDFKVKCDTVTPSQAGASEQKSRMEDLLARGYKGIAIGPYNALNQVDMINMAAEKATIITTDTDSPTSKRLCFVGTNNYEAGKIAGELLKKALPDGGKVWIFVATLDMQNAADRYKGIVDVVKGTKINILGVKTDSTDRARAKSNVEEAMSQTPDLAGLVGLFSYNGPAIVSAVDGRQKNIKIVCFDEDTVTLQAARDGVIEGTVVQDPFKFGYECVRILAAIARKEDPKIPANKIVDTGVKVIDKSNVDEFEADLKKKLGK